MHKFKVVMRRNHLDAATTRTDQTLMKRRALPPKFAVINNIYKL
jgi:hypothetical protein